jgi:hypothetical protein
MARTHNRIQNPEEEVNNNPANHHTEGNLDL